MKKMKKILALALMALSLFAVAMPAPAMAANSTLSVGSTGTIDSGGNGSVNIRNAANGGTVWGTLYTNSTFQVVAIKTVSNVVWYQINVTYKAGGTFNQSSYSTRGWVNSNFVRGSSTPTDPSNPTANYQALFGTRTMKRGHSGEDVRNLQQALHLLGYMAWNEVDGIFGSITESAVWQYQFATFMDNPDCQVGPNTKTWLFNNSTIQYYWTYERNVYFTELN